ncbi:MAG: response regulator, partial [Gemmatimonadota bacterium]
MPAACRKTVVLVDDDVEIRHVMTAILSHEGYDVATASNGLEAMTRLRAMRRPCVILLDLMMPVMDGWQFRARQKDDPGLAEIPVVVLSAVPNVSDRAASLQADAYLQKPVDLDDLLQTVGRYCGE